LYCHQLPDGYGNLQAVAKIRVIRHPEHPGHPWTSPRVPLDQLTNQSGTAAGKLIKWKIHPKKDMGTHQTSFFLKKFVKAWKGVRFLKRCRVKIKNKNILARLKVKQSLFYTAY
jgi:hypothetical protein